MDFDDSSASSEKRSLRHSQSSANGGMDFHAFESVVQDAGAQALSFENDFEGDEYVTRSVSPEKESHHRFFEDDVDRPHARRGRLPDGSSQRLGTVTNAEYKENDDIYSCVNLPEMVLNDRTMISRLFIDAGPEKSIAEDDSTDSSVERMVKHLSLFSPQFSLRQSHDDSVLEMIQRTVEQIVAHAMDVQQALEDGFFTASEDKPEWVPVCRGVRSVSVDSNFNIIAEIDVEPYVVSLDDIVAFSAQPLPSKLVVSFLKLIVVSINKLHEAGMVHGCLHGGNVMFSSNNGLTILTGVGGVMSSLLFPSDPSFISPHLATAMRPIVDCAWNSQATRERESDDLFPWASVGQLHDAILSLYGVRSGKDGNPVIQPRDDIYAIGVLALTCLLGVPAFHGATLKEVVESLTVSGDGTRRTPHPKVLMGSVFSTTYARRRFLLAEYEEQFIDDVQDFVLLCLNTEKFIEGSIDELLNHRLFSNNPICEPGNTATQSWKEEKYIIDCMLHRVVYPVYQVLECVRNGCGTTPMFLRAYRNSIFASRWESLQSAWLTSPENGSDEIVHSGSLCVLWPYIDRAASVCGRPLPEWNLNMEANETVGSSLLYKANTKQTLHLQRLEEVAKSKDMFMCMDEQSLVYHGRTQTRLVLRRDELPNEHCAKTLILSDLQNCDVKILAAFQYVVLKNVQSCNVVLGPCQACYCAEMVDTTFAVAAGRLLLDSVKRVNLRYSGLTPPRCKDTSSLSEISLAPFDVAYAGMTLDFAFCNLPQEHGGTLQTAVRDDDDCGFSTTVTPAMESIQRNLVLHDICRTGFDYPYSHALAAFGSQFIHQDDNVSDVFLYGDVYKKNILISRIRGDSQSSEDNPLPPSCSPFSSDATRNLLWPPQQPESGSTELKKQKCPIIFILDVVGDCIIEDCSNCTVFVAASAEGIVVRRCSHMRLFLMGREMLLEECEFVDVYMFASECLGLRSCSNAELFPLALSAPRVEELLAAMINGCDDESQREMYNTLFNQKDVDSLNVLFHSSTDTDDVFFDECNEVHVNDQSAVMIVVDFVPSEDQPSRFFYEAYEDKRQTTDWVHVSFIERTWGFSADTRRQGTVGLPAEVNAVGWNERRKAINDENSKSWMNDGQLQLPVRFHNLVNASVLRLPGTISGRADCGQLVDVVLEHIATGVIHFNESVGTLFIRRCAGPLNIVVCAARCVVVEECEHVTLQTACVSLTAKNCHGCHFALHTNTPPCYIGCSLMLTSTLNITSVDFEGFLDRAGVEYHINHFSTPHIQPTKSESLFATDVSSAAAPADIGDVDTLAKALAVLQSPVFVVPPLPGMCVGVSDAAFLDFIEDRVNSERKRVGFDERVMSALSFLSRSPLKSFSAAGLCEGAAPPRHVDPLACEEASPPESKIGEKEKDRERAASDMYEDDYEEEDNEVEQVDEKRKGEEERVQEEEQMQQQAEEQRQKGEQEEEQDERLDGEEGDGRAEEKQMGVTTSHFEKSFPLTNDSSAKSDSTSSSSSPSSGIDAPRAQSNDLEEKDQVKTVDEIKTQRDTKDEIIEHNSPRQSATTFGTSCNLKEDVSIDEEDVFTLCARSKNSNIDDGMDPLHCPTEAKQICAEDDATAQQSVTEGTSFDDGEREMDLVTYHSIPAESIADDHNPSPLIPLGEGGNSETGTCTFGLWGNLVMHKDESEMIQDVLVQVEAARSRFRTAKTKYDYSMEELQQRVRNAVERIQSFGAYGEY